jgi:hypothetical protein
LGRAALERNKTVFFDLPDAEIAKIKTALKVLEEEWLAEAKKRNLPGDEILSYAKTMTEKYVAAKRVNVP